MAKKRKKRTPNTDPSMLRINKVLAAAGLGSRRDVEELVIQGRVEVDREIVTDLAFRVNPSISKIKVDGEVLKQPRKVYYILNKPPGVLSTNHDPSGRIRVIDLVPDQQRVFSVGRLDRSSEGLILLTNDGELAQRLAHPKYRIQKSYFVVVAGLMTKEELAKLRKGVHLAEGFAKIDGATIRKHRKGCTELEILLSEGKNREIRRILARAGHKVVLLRRIAIGTLRLGQLPVGASRELTAAEVKALYNVSKPKATKKAAPKKASAKKATATPAKPSTKPLANTEEEFAFDDDDLIANLNSLDESNLDDAAFSDDEFGLGELPDAYDDDFVGGFDATPKSGSVIGADDDELKPRSRAKKKPSRRNPSSRSTPRSGATKSTKRSESKPAKRGAKSSSKTSSAKGTRGGSSRGGKATGKGATSKRAATKRSSPRRGAKSPPKGGRR
ncbi:MAG: hypothetical protein Aurels2KO_19150 [Aureliella sp.]